MLRAVHGEECAGWTLAQVVAKMIEVGRPVMLTFEVLTDTVTDTDTDNAVGPSSRLSSKAKSVNGDAASEVSASERKKRGEAAAKAVEDNANSKAKPGKQSVFKEQKEAARLAGAILQPK